MDFIVTSCTSIAHVAGALDLKTFVLSPIMSYYTWVEELEHPSWYSDNLTLFLQKQPRDWNGPFEELKKYI